MGENTKIEWTHLPGYKPRTWNPMVGCSKVSAGCKNCYAMKWAHRFRQVEESPFFGLTKENGEWTGEVRLRPEVVDQAARWRQPSAVFVDSMTDLFHEAIPDMDIAAVYGQMVAAWDSIFMVLTKRTQRAAHLLNQPWFWKAVDNYADKAAGGPSFRGFAHIYNRAPYPPNVWLGTSIENRDTLSRLDDLRQTQAALRMVSFEPLLEDLGRINLEGIGWAIVGGESGPGARRFEVDWARSLRDQARKAGVPFFMKQMGKIACDHNDQGFEGEEPHHWPEGTEPSPRPTSFQGESIRILLKSPKGGDMAEWPEDLRIRQFPQLAASSPEVGRDWSKPLNLEIVEEP